MALSENKTRLGLPYTERPFEERLAFAKQQWEFFLPEIRQVQDFTGVERLDHIVGDSRSGSTPLLLLLAQLLGRKGIYQAGKADLRLAAQGFGMNGLRYGDYGNQVLAKDTTGGPHLLDCLYDPLAVNLEAEDGHGIQKDKVKLIMLSRNPFDNFYGWLHRYLNPFHLQHVPNTRQSLLEKFTVANRTIKSVYNRIQELGIQHVVFPQEFLEKSPTDPARGPVSVIQNMLSTIGLEFERDQIEAATTTDWQPKSQEEIDELIYLPPEPIRDNEAVVMDPLRRTGGYRYYGNPWRKAAARLLPEEVESLSECSFVSGYNGMVLQAASQLGVSDYQGLLIDPEEAKSLAGTALKM